VRVGVLEPGGVKTELASHNKLEIRHAMTTSFYEQTEIRNAEHITDGVAYTVSRAACLERTSHED
jgi:NADP-dependent 3-hydroxy acid dehydrogenase YdfG